MRLEEKGELVALLTRLAAYYGRKPLPVGVIEIYFEALADYDLAVVRAAMSAHVRSTEESGKFFPKVADIRALIEGGSGDKADRAWAKVERAIGAHGAWESVGFDDAIIHRVVSDMGGWIGLCHVSLKELPFKRNEFVRRYQALIGRELGNYPRKLVGIAEHENGQMGYEAEPPALIGDKQRALLVFKRGSDKARIEATSFVSNEAFEAALNGVVRLEVQA